VNGQPAAAAAPARPTRRAAWLEIDLDAIEHNVATIRGLVGRTARVAPVVKADAYGHGLVPVARALAPSVDALCVATLDEGLALRAAGIVGRIILLYPVPPDSVQEAIHADLEPTVMSDRDATAIVRAVAAEAAPDRGRAVRVQLAIETGMNRGGVRPEEAAAVARRLSGSGVVLAGTWTHQCCPEDAVSAAAQVTRFEAAIAAIADAGVATGERHVASSGGIFAATAPVADLIRPGLATYGLLGDSVPLPAETAVAAAALRPALSLKAHAVAFGDVPAGASVGYGATWRAERSSRIATLPVGYGDGYARTSQPGASALVRGHRVPLVGIVSMDALGVDVTDVFGVDHDDEFVLLGAQGDERIGAGELARARNTIAWEVLSGMAARLDRVYHRPTAAGSPRITIDRPRGSPP
jgi:alanine racemase